MMINTTIRMVLVSMLSAILLIASGCGSHNGEITIPAGSEGESITVNTDNSLPDNFPRNIPIPEGAEIQTVISNADSIMVGYDIDHSFEDALKIYKDHYRSSNYVELQETLIEDSYSGSGTLEGNQLTVTISRPDPAKTSVLLIYKFKK